MGKVTTLPAAAAGLREPEPLTPDHDLTKFQCKEHPDLAMWLQQRALKSEGRSARTYILPLGNRAIGYYCIAAGSIMRVDVNNRTRQNMPEPIPALVIGRLAIDDEFAAKGYGKAILKHALLRCLHANKLAGARAIVVHAKDEKAAGFYLKYRFIQSPTNPLTYFLPIETVEQALA